MTKLKKNKIHMNRFLLIVTTVLIFAGCGGLQPEPISFESKPYFFDVGGSNTPLGFDSKPITPEFKYSQSNGYGWLSEDLEGFYHEDWEASRNAMIIDGLKADEIAFKADLNEEDWWLTLWIDGGLEDSSTVSLSINGIEQELELQAFSPHAENGVLRESPQKMYRIIQRRVETEQGSLTFKLKGGRDVARLLAFSLIPDKIAPQNDEQKEAMALFEEKAAYNSADSASSFNSIIENIPDSEESEIFKAFWKQNISILQEAEKYFYYRGWGWATDKTGLSLFDHLHQSVMLYDAIVNSSSKNMDPLFERALWYRGRTLYWLELERGGYNEGRQGREDLARMYELYPENKLVRMYNGEKIDTEDEFDDISKPSGAPEWAFVQWELTNRLKNIVDWWVNEQQAENGEFGGKFGDDVEILRWWSPLILSGDENTYKGWKRLADGVWNSNKVYKGYAKNPSDVEHSSEFISDSAPLMVLFNDDKEYQERLGYSARYFRDLWTGYNENGNRFFKSAWFSSTEVEMEEPKNRDVIYNGRAVKAVRYYHWKTNDPATESALIEWADSWYTVSQKTDKGKPKGVIPASVEFPTEIINGDGPTWYEANMFWPYFDWRDGKAILDQLLFTWTFTGDDKYLEPIFQNLELVKEYQDDINKAENPYEPGSEGWAAYSLGNRGGFWNVVETWRILTGNTQYDALIAKYGEPYIKFRLTGDPSPLVSDMEEYLETVRYNNPMRTTEAIHTDRVFIKGTNEREAKVLLGMITGFAIDESASPYIAVSWENTTRDMTYLVSENDSTSLNVQLYNFGEANKAITMRPWQLRKGSYVLTESVEGVENSRNITVQKGGDRFDVSVPSLKLTEIKIKPKTGN